MLHGSCWNCHCVNYLVPGLMSLMPFAPSQTELFNFAALIQAQLPVSFSHAVFFRGC